MLFAELTEYFTAERQGGYLLVALAVASFGFAAFLWMTRNAFRAMVWPLVVFGLFQVVIGLALALRTPGQVASLEDGLRTTLTETVSAETERMHTVNRNFRIIKVVEAVIIVCSLLLIMLLPHPSTWAAVGLGLLIETCVLLVFDTFAHHRALAYNQWLQGLVA